MRPKVYLAILIISSLYFSCANVQLLQDKNIYTINKSIVAAGVDAFNNLYVVDKKNVISKYENLKISGIQYADNTLGNISTLDVTNPLKLLVYKSDYGQAILLDNTLSEIERINLYEHNYNSVPVMATSSDGNLWMYDKTDYKLKKVNSGLKVILESNSLRDYNLQHLNPSLIIERNGKLVIQDNEKGVLLFDNLGQYIQLFPFITNAAIQFDGVNIIYFTNGILKAYNTKLYDESAIPIDINKKTDLKNIKVGLHDLFYIYDQGIDVIPRQS